MENTPKKGGFSAADGTFPERAKKQITSGYEKCNLATMYQHKVS